jgi:uncharacterized protein (DUF2062 family)
LSPAFAVAGAQDLWRRRFAGPFFELLNLQIRPETLALSIALGFVFGICPLIGIPTLLCIAAAVVLRLNPAILQLVNYLVYPLQIALLLPFFRLGGHLFRSPPGSFSPAQFVHACSIDLPGAMTTMGSSALHAAAAWFCVGAPAGLLLYFCILEALRRNASGSVTQTQHALLFPLQRALRQPFEGRPE